MTSGSTGAPGSTASPPPGLASVRADRAGTKVLSDQARTDDMAVLGELRPVRAAGEHDLRRPGHEQRVGDPEDRGQDYDGDGGADEVAAHQNRCVVSDWTTGPSSSAGKKVSAPTSTITPISSTTNVGVSVRIVPGPAGATFLPASAPATASTRMIGAKRANIIVSPPIRSASLIPCAPRLPACGWT